MPKLSGPSVCIGLLAILCASPAASQTTPVFEVASVKPSNSATPAYTMRGGPGTTDPDRITYTNIMLRAVLLNAYDVKSYQLSGPDWLNTLRFDITATLPAGSTKEQLQAMLRNLLETRFRMSLHREPKEMAIYALIVDKNGPRIKPAAEDGAVPAELGPDQLATVQKAEGRDGFPVVAMRSPGVIIETKNGRARISAKAVPMTKLADTLSTRVGRPVIDSSGLAGNFNFAIYFTPEGADTGDSPEPDIFHALPEQLGLRLEARRAPIEMLVIDHAEKTPIEN